MARLEIKGMEELMRSIERLANVPDEVFDKMLKAQAAVVIPVQKRHLAALGLKHPTGQVMASISPSVKMRRDRAGTPSLYVYPKGKRRGKKTSNAEVGFIIEYGAPGRGIAPRPWMRPANQEAEEPATDAARKVYEDWAEKQ